MARIELICPAPAGSLHGNRTTAERWARLLRSLGHRVSISETYEGERCDVLVALHARRSAEALFKYRCSNPDKPALLALTGTDLYYDIRRSPRAQQALEAATRLIVLQPLAVSELSPHLRAKARVIYQSAERTRPQAARNETYFDVCVAGHLRRVKDPFRTAYASRRLPSSSKIRVLHIGSAREPLMAETASREQERNERYHWLGALPRTRARRTIASSRVMVLSSKLEGGANVISEAVVDRVPVLASRIPGSVGLLGEDYPGYFPVSDTDALTELLVRSETDARFYGELKAWCSKLASGFSPASERKRWDSLIREVRSLP